MTAGKGSRTRPRAISREEWDARHAQTFPAYWRVERQRADGTWRQVSPGGMGSLEFNLELFKQLAVKMKRGAIRLVDNHGRVDREFTAGDPGHD